MAEDPEALAQLARLLGDARLRDASREAIEAAVDDRLAQLVDGLLAEASASDDVLGRESASAFLEDRLDFLSPLLGEHQRVRLREALYARIEAW